MVKPKPERGELLVCGLVVMACGQMMRDGTVALRKRKWKFMRRRRRRSRTQTSPSNVRLHLRTSLARFEERYAAKLRLQRENRERLEEGGERGGAG